MSAHTYESKPAWTDVPNDHAVRVKDYESDTWYTATSFFDLFESINNQRCPLLDEAFDWKTLEHRSQAIGNMIIAYGLAKYDHITFDNDGMFGWYDKPFFDRHMQLFNDSNGDPDSILDWGEAIDELEMEVEEPIVVSKLTQAEAEDEVDDESIENALNVLRAAGYKTVDGLLQPPQ